jgi:hypothetical protein
MAVVGAIVNCKMHCLFGRMLFYVRLESESNEYFIESGHFNYGLKITTPVQYDSRHS